MDAVKLTVQLTEEYRERINKAKTSEDLRKCRSWIDLLAPAAESAEVEINGDHVILRCNTPKGAVQDSCAYEGVLAVIEMQDGILLRLSHRRLLWLPVSEDGPENELLMNAMMLLCKHSSYMFRTARLKLKGVSAKKKIAFRFRSRQGHYTGDNFVRVSIIALVCLLFFAAIGFVSQPFQHQKIEKQNAIMLSAILDRVDPVYGKSSVSYMQLQFRDAEAQSVDGCCLGYGLEEKLESIPPGTQMQLLIHPVSGEVLQIKVAEETLLDFDYAQDQLWSESLFFAGLSVFMSACAVGLLYVLIRKNG